MVKAEFNSYLKSPEILGADSLSKLEQLTEKFPYFSTSQLLLTKNLHNLEHLDYAKKLKQTAIRVADRKRLYYLIMQPSLIDKIEKAEQPITGEASAQETVQPEQDIHTPTPQRVTELEQQILDEAISASIAKEVTPSLDKAPQSERDTPEKPKKQTFTNWLETLSGSEATPRQASVEDLIDKFLEANPKITSKSEFFSPTNTAKISLVDDENFVTETLAKIYSKQGNIEKAINAYRQLSLNNPKKSSYFATRISELEKRLEK